MPELTVFIPNRLFKVREAGPDFGNLNKLFGGDAIDLEEKERQANKIRYKVRIGNIEVKSL
ncbi:hypothetical protein [Thermoplasma volcanium]|uniref:hypothetical protein n=1 Tax=Thermoplasma volcanium TaxID=50339 RepID=UPI0012EA0BFA|nr:hypothetical protein [Thermoplasma volcanium]